jgi:hypothetical protein
MELLYNYAEEMGTTVDNAKKHKKKVIERIIKSLHLRFPTRSNAAIKRDANDEFDLRLVADLYKHQVQDALDKIKENRADQLS